MNILYIASDVSFPSSNGGSTRVYETARIFKEHGHKSVILVNKDDDQLDYENYKGIHIYRIKMFDVMIVIREIIDKFRGLIGKNTITPSSTKYDTFYPHLMIRDFRWKITDIYRHKIPIHKWLKTIPAIYKTFQLVKKEKIDIIIERGPSYGVGIIPAKTLNRKYVLDFIDVLYSNFSLRFSDVVLSYFSKIQIPQFVNRNKIQIVYTSTDIERFKPRKKDINVLNDYNLKHKFVVMYAGGIYPWHGLDLLVESAELIQDDNIHFMIVGDGPYKEHIEKMVHDKQLQDKFTFTGKVKYEKVPFFLNTADVGVSLNTGDAIGFKMIEYMSSGLPVISTNADSLRFMGDNEKELLYTKQNNPIDLKNNILRLKNNSELCRKLQQNARIRTKKHFSWHKHYYNIINAIGLIKS